MKIAKTIISVNVNLGSEHDIFTFRNLIHVSVSVL